MSESKHSVILDLLSQARAEGRREGLEEAARLADRDSAVYEDPAQTVPLKCLAAAIRAIAQKEGKDGPHR